MSPRVWLERFGVCLGVPRGLRKGLLRKWLEVVVSLESTSCVLFCLS